MPNEAAKFRGSSDVFHSGPSHQAEAEGRASPRDGLATLLGRSESVPISAYNYAQAASNRNRADTDRGPLTPPNISSAPKSHSSSSSDSIRSMNDASSEGRTAPATPANADSPGAAIPFDGLSIQPVRPQSSRPSFSPAIASKRGAAASIEGERSPKQPHPGSPWRQPAPGRQRTSRPTPQRSPHQKPRTHKAAHPYPHAGPQAHPLPQESAHGPAGSGSSIFQPPVPQIARDKPAAMVASPLHAPRIHELDQLDQHRKRSYDRIPPAAPDPIGKGPYPSGTRGGVPADPPPVRWQPRMQSSTSSEYPGMILQPDSSPISEEQLAAEIRGIYEGVATVEVKCIDIDAALARDTKSQLGVEQWQALIALHRTLLYEHHDFLMATQHPSASEQLKGLATKYSMPARMWKHGIHAFLEVLRHRRPESQDYMLAFVVLAYQMMALLFETVPCFTDTWIECLGDLARYRMAIEDDREMHAVWGGVAARWYTLASDRHPEIGRLYHHLGILERPSMRKLASYAKSLTCSIPFGNAKDSMMTFCKPIVQEEHLSKANTGSAEAALVTFYALVLMESDLGKIQTSATGASKLLWDQPSVKTKEYGVPLALTSISALFEFGSQHNKLWQVFSEVIDMEKRSARPSEIALPGSSNRVDVPPLASTSPAPHVVDFYYNCCNALTRPQSSSQGIEDVLASVHVILVWFHSLYSLGLRSNDARNTSGLLMDPHRFSWGGLCEFLNGLCRDTAIDESIFEAARQGSFPKPREPEKFVSLGEDYWIRGLLWGGFCLPKDVLPARTDEIESSQGPAARVGRVQWLALLLALRMDYFNYDVHRKAFWAPVPGPPPTAQVDRVDSLASTATQSNVAPTRATTWATITSAPTSPASTSRSSTTFEDGDGYTVVPRPRKKPTPSYASVAASRPKKARPDVRNVKIGNADEVY